MLTYLDTEVEYSHSGIACLVHYCMHQVPVKQGQRHDTVDNHDDDVHRLTVCMSYAGCNSSLRHH